MKKMFRKFLALGVIFTLVFGFGVYFGVPGYFKSQAAKLDLPPLKIGESSVVYASDGKQVLGHIAATGSGSKSLNGDEMPALLRHVHMAAEDRSFYKHGAISGWGLAKAMITNAKNGAISAGGSTITQQYVKNAYLSQEQTAERKLREAQYAYLVESKFTKDEILDKYMNSNYYGRGSYGVNDATQTWFGRSATTISDINNPEQVAMASFLAALIKSPSYYATMKNGKLVHQDEVVGRQKYVLDGLRKIKGIDGNQMVSESTIAQAKALLPLKVSTDTKATGSSNDTDPFLLDYIKDWMSAWQAQVAKTTYSLSDDEANKQGEANAESMLARGGLTIKTSVDYSLQNNVAQAVKAKLPSGGLSAGVIIMNPQTGGIVAMYGGTNYAKDGYNNALYANRQPGSTMKPIVLTSAVKEGISVQSKFAAPASIVIDGPAIWNDDKKAAANCELTVADAIAYSSNPVAIELISGKMASCDGSQQLTAIEKDYPVSPTSTEKMYRDLGGDVSLVPGRTSETKIDKAVRLAIGDTLTTTPLKMASVYSTVANGGKYVSRYIVDNIKSNDGNNIYQNNSSSKRVISEDEADTVSQVLTGVFTKGTAKGAQVSGHPLAGKTGTTNSDAWMVAYNAKDSADKVPTYTCAAWAGYKDNRDTNGDLWGSDVAKICQSFFASALKSYPTVNFASANMNAGREIGLGQMAMPSPSPSPSSPSPSKSSLVPSTTTTSRSPSLKANRSASATSTTVG